MNAGSRSAAIAGFVAGLTADTLPADCRELARRGLLDAIGCGLYGQTLPQTDWVRAIAADGGPGVASAWGGGPRLAAPRAALLNGTAVHATEMSETFIRAGVHPGNVIVPAAVATAEAVGSSGAELLTAIAAAYEVLIRWGLTAGLPTMMTQRLHTFSMLGVIGAAAASAKLRFGADAGRIGHALGIAATMTPTTLLDAARDGATIKDAYEGQAAETGVRAAQYADLGVTAPDGWAEAWFVAVAREPDLARLTDGIGVDWLMRTGLRIKPRPVMALVQPASAAVEALLDQGAVPVERVRRIRIDSTRRSDIGRSVAPVSLTGAKASIPFTVAAILSYPERLRADPFMLGFFTEKMLADQRILDLARRCAVCVDDEFEYNFEQAPQMRYESRVTVQYEESTGLPDRVAYADVWPVTSRLTFDGVVPKFRACATRRVPAAIADQIVDAVRDLGPTTGVDTLSALLSQPVRRDAAAGVPGSGDAAGR